MRFWRRRRALVCRQAVELMADYLDGRLPPKELARLKEHLAACPHCSEYLAQLRVTIDALGRGEPDALTDDALDELVGLYRRWRERRSSTLHARLGRPRRGSTSVRRDLLRRDVGRSRYRCGEVDRLPPHAVGLEM